MNQNNLHDERTSSKFSDWLNILQHMKLWQKFAVLALVMVPAVAVPLYQFFTTVQQEIAFAQTQQVGLDPTLKLIEIIQVTQEHRGLSAGLLGGDDTLSSLREETQERTDRLMVEMDELLQQQLHAAHAEPWQTVRTSFPRIARDVGNLRISADASFDRHTEIIGSYFVLLDQMIDDYGLSLDFDPETSYLIEAALIGLPRLTEPFGQLRAVGTGALTAARALPSTEEFPDIENHVSEADAAADFRPELAVRVTALTTLGERDLEFVRQSMMKAFEHSPELADGPLAAAFEATELETRGMVDLAQDELLATEALTFEPGAYFDRFTQGITMQLDLTEMAAEVLRTQFAAKVSDFRRGLQLQAFMVVVIVFVAGLLGYAVARSVLQPVAHLQGVMEGLRQGDTTLRARLKSSDEIGELARHFDTMVDEREAVSARLADENEALNESVIDILRALTRLSRGDLTIAAPVREDITGALSDAINSMTRSTAQALAHVSVASNEVRSASQKGRETVLDTSRGMNDIRATIQETVKRMKRLGEHSQEITGIVKVIEEIAERTSVLALNANMQAAMAGEAGRGFRVVADEVQQLAERSKEATGEVGKLVDTIQSETSMTMSTMDNAVGEVVKGGELADSAADQVTHLDELGEQLLQFIGAFKLPPELLEKAGVDNAADRRVA